MRPRPVHPRPTARQTADQRSQFGLDLANRLTQITIESHPSITAELLAYSERLRACNDRANVWYAEDLHNRHGECFDGAGRLFQCGLKLCQHCLSTQSQRHRRRLRAILEQQRLSTSEHYKFITLTIQNPSVGLIATRNIIDRAWRLFRNLKWFHQTITGACKSEEFTLTANGFHYHLHLLARARYISYFDIRYHWTQCVAKATAETGRILNPQTADKLLIVNVKPITSFHAAVNEVAKYITKGSSAAAMRDDDLREFALVDRFPRMFELIGFFRSPHLQPHAPADDDAITKAIVHTNVLSELRREQPWRIYVRKYGIDAYLDRLFAQIAATQEIRRTQLLKKYHAATFHRLAYAPASGIRQAELRLQFIAARTATADLAY